MALIPAGVFNLLDIYGVPIKVCRYSKENKLRAERGRAELVRIKEIFVEEAGLETRRDFDKRKYGGMWKNKGL